MKSIFFKNEFLNWKWIFLLNLNWNWKNFVEFGQNGMWIWNFEILKHCYLLDLTFSMPFWIFLNLKLNNNFSSFLGMRKGLAYIGRIKAISTSNGGLSILSEKMKSKESCRNHKIIFLKISENLTGLTCV